MNDVALVTGLIGPSLYAVVVKLYFDVLKRQMEEERRTAGTDIIERHHGGLHRLRSE